MNTMDTIQLKTDIGKANEPNRDQWIRERLLELPAGLTLLDAGAGEMKYKPHCSHLKYTSQDFCQYDGSGDGAGFQMQKWDVSRIDIVGDICNIPLPDQSFDVVLCTEVFEHLPDPRAAIKEFSRLLKPGGRLIMTAPFCSMTHFAPHFYATGLSRYFYEDVCEKNGMKVQSITYNGSYFQYVAQELRRTGDVAEKYSNQKLGFFWKVLRRLFLWKLDRMERADQGSKEIMCFGLMVTARKN